jgi:hypothetical protein
VLKGARRSIATEEAIVPSLRSDAAYIAIEDALRQETSRGILRDSSTMMPLLEVQSGEPRNVAT